MNRRPPQNRSVSAACPLFSLLDKQASCYCALILTKGASKVSSAISARFRAVVKLLFTLSIGNNRSSSLPSIISFRISTGNMSRFDAGVFSRRSHRIAVGTTHGSEPAEPTFNPEWVEQRGTVGRVFAPFRIENVCGSNRFRGPPSTAIQIAPFQGAKA